MKRNEVYTHEDEIIRVLLIKDDACLVIDCNNNSMPVWRNVDALFSHSLMKDEDFYALKGFEPVEDDMISTERKRVMHERYTLDSRKRDDEILVMNSEKP